MTSSKTKPAFYLSPHQLFQNLANRPLNEPVTFGHLWNNGGNIEKERESSSC